jgi:hypothetical protein
MKNNKTWESRFLGYKILVSNLLLLLAELKMKRKMGQVFGFITNRYEFFLLILMLLLENFFLFSSSKKTVGFRSEKMITF